MCGFRGGGGGRKGRYLPAFGGFWSLAPLKTPRKTPNKPIRVGPPLAKLSGSEHGVWSFQSSLSYDQCSIIRVYSQSRVG